MAKKPAKKPVRTAKKATKRPVTKRATPAKEPATAREVLDIIDKFMSVESQSWPRGTEGGQWLEARRLWDILSALRGPDSGDCDLKDRTTTRIRTAALPLCAASQDSGAKARASFSIMMAKSIELAKNGVSSTHFSQHAKLAAEALGLAIKED